MKKMKVSRHLIWGWETEKEVWVRWKERWREKEKIGRKGEWQRGREWEDATIERRKHWGREWVSEKEIDLEKAQIAQEKDCETDNAREINSSRHDLPLSSWPTYTRTLALDTEASLVYVALRHPLHTHTHTHTHAHMHTPHTPSKVHPPMHVDVIKLVIYPSPCEEATVWVSVHLAPLKLHNT